MLEWTYEEPGNEWVGAGSATSEALSEIGLTVWIEKREKKMPETMTREMAIEMMAYYDTLVEHAWVDIKQWAEDGDKECIARLEHKESTEFVWSLLQDDIIGDGANASVVANPIPAEAEAELVRQLAVRLALPLETVQKQVGRLMQEGLIQPVPVAEGFQWQWQDSPLR